MAGLAIDCTVFAALVAAQTAPAALAEPKIADSPGRLRPKIGLVLSGAGARGITRIGGSLYAGGSIEAGNTWQQRSDASTGDLITAGSVFVADAFLGPFHFAYGRASGGASSFYLLLGRP